MTIVLVPGKALRARNDHELGSDGAVNEKVEDEQVEEAEHEDDSEDVEEQHKERNLTTSGCLQREPGKERDKDNECEERDCESQGLELLLLAQRWRSVLNVLRQILARKPRVEVNGSYQDEGSQH